MEQELRSKIQSIVERYPESISLLFKEYGYNIETPTVNNLIAAYYQYKEPFLAKLYEISVTGDYYSAEGTNKKKQQKQKGEGWQKFKDTFTQILGVATGVGGIATALQGTLSKPAQAEVPEAHKNKILGMPVGLFVLLIIVIALIIIMVIKK